MRNQSNSLKHLQAAQLQLSREQPSNGTRSNRPQWRQLSQQMHAWNVFTARNNWHELAFDKLLIHAHNKTAAVGAFHEEISGAVAMG